MYGLAAAPAALLAVGTFWAAGRAAQGYCAALGAPCCCLCCARRRRALARRAPAAGETHAAGTAAVRRWWQRLASPDNVHGLRLCDLLLHLLLHLPTVSQAWRGSQSRRAGCCCRGRAQQLPPPRCAKPRAGWPATVRCRWEGPTCCCPAFTGWGPRGRGAALWALLAVLLHVIHPAWLAPTHAPPTPAPAPASLPPSLTAHPTPPFPPVPTSQPPPNLCACCPKPFLQAEVDDIMEAMAASPLSTANGGGAFGESAGLSASAAPRRALNARPRQAQAGPGWPTRLPTAQPTDVPRCGATSDGRLSCLAARPQHAECGKRPRPAGHAKCGTTAPP